MKPAQQPHKVSREIGVRSKLIQGGLNSEVQHLSGPTVPTAFLFGYALLFSLKADRVARFLSSVDLPTDSLMYGSR